ncbi:MAG: O-methyltransferase [Thermoplasmata archaeon]
MRPEDDPDPVWVQRLSGYDAGATSHAIAEAQAQRRLFSHLAKEHRNEGRDSYVEIDAPLELHALVRLLHPLHVLEVGVSSGVSSAYLLHALDMNGEGTLHSIDLPKPSTDVPGNGRPSRVSWSLPRGRSAGGAVPFGLRKRWDLRLGNKSDVIPILTRELARIDLVVYDVPHDDRATRGEFHLVDPRVPPGGVLIVDHGPAGGCCSALRSRAKEWGSVPVRRSGLGLYGARRSMAGSTTPDRSGKAQGPDHRRGGSTAPSPGGGRRSGGRSR